MRYTVCIIIDKSAQRKVKELAQELGAIRIVCLADEMEVTFASKEEAEVFSSHKMVESL